MGQGPVAKFEKLEKSTNLSPIGTISHTDHDHPNSPLTNTIKEIWDYYAKTNKDYEHLTADETIAFYHHLYSYFQKNGERFSEFITLPEEETIALWVERFDVDNDGKLSWGEFKEVLELFSQGKKVMTVSQKLILKMASTDPKAKAIMDVMKLLQHFLIDVAFGDFLLGCFIFESYHRYNIPHSGVVAPIDEVKEAYKYMKYASAVYGWKFIEAFWSSGSKRDAIKGMVYRKVNREKEILLNNACFEKHSGINVKDFIHYTWWSQTFAPAHVLFFNHKDKEIILTIRGSSDENDAISDIICDYDDFMGGKTHRGMLSCAKNKLGEFEDKILDAFKRHPDYKLIVTGHSLGAGTAALIGLIFNDKHPEIPIKVWVYGTPPILDLESARKSSNIINSVISRYDVIPRLTFGALYELKENVKQILHHNHSKTMRMWQLIAAGKSFGQAVHTSLEKRLGESGIHGINILKGTKERIYTPGKVYNLRNELDKSTAWVCEIVDNKLFDEIPMNMNMYYDHHPEAYETRMMAYIEKKNCK